MTYNVFGGTLNHTLLYAIRCQILWMAKMYQIQFRLGHRPDPAGSAYSAPPDPLAGLRGLLLRGRQIGLVDSRENQ